MPKGDKVFPERHNSALARSLRITALYFLVGAMWIIFTEMAVINHLGKFTEVSAINIFKGMVYVLLTACLIFALVYSGFKKLIVINQRLQKSEAMLLDAQKLTHIGSYDYDEASHRIACTDELLRILGIAPEAFNGEVETILQRIHPEDRRFFSNFTIPEDSRAMGTEQQCRVIRADGEERVITWRTVRTYSEQGTLIRSSGTAQDITEHNHSEIALKQERDQAERYLDIATTIFLIVDRHGVATLINRTGCETLGLTKEQILGSNWIERFIATTDRQAAKALLRAIAAGDGEKYRVHESQLLTVNGQERSIVWRSTALTNEDGTIVGVLASGMDITELKQAIDHLRESERSKSVLLSNLPGMAFRCQYNRKRAMQFISDGCYPLTGYRPEEFYGNNNLFYNVIICEEYRELVQAENANTLACRIPFKFEYEIVTASGEKKWVLETSQGVYNAKGEAEAIEGIIIDITESKRRTLQIQYLNDHDALTGLYNRLYFEEAKTRLNRAGKLPLAIILTDINSLKLINDAFGSETGDRMISKAADILKACCSGNDVLARTGGDEFSILAPDTGRESADGLIASIRAAFKLYNNAIADKTQAINLSIALSVKERFETDMVETTKQAEDSLSRQKLLDKGSHHNAMLTTIMATMYERSFETEEHAERIAELSSRIGSKMNLQQRQLDELHLFSMLHDIGKIGIRDQILKKPAKLTEEEWSEMRKHPEIGYRIAMSAPELSTVAEYILTHHERWDGTGYPRGLKGMDIPLLSRILSVADAYDAMTEDRVYHKGMPKEQAIEEICRNAGAQFDPAIVEVFQEVIAEAGTVGCPSVRYPADVGTP